MIFPWLQIREYKSEMARRIDLLNRTLKDVDSSVRKSAATILGFIWRQKGHRFSVEALNDENAMVWRGAAEALANIE